jgi:hypothetical protein
LRRRSICIVLGRGRTIGLVALGLDKAFDKGSGRSLDFSVDDHSLFAFIRKNDLADFDANLEFALVFLRKLDLNFTGVAVDERDQSSVLQMVQIGQVNTTGA